MKVVQRKDTKAKSGYKPAKISSVGGLVKYLLVLSRSSTRRQWLTLHSENVEKPGAAASTILPASEIL